MQTRHSDQQRGRRPYTAVAVLLVCVLLACGPAAAMKNPAAVYCEALGYQYVTVTTDSGGATGRCQVSATEQVSAWKFLQGEAAPEKGYCAQQGYEYKQVTDPAVCKEFGLDTCMVCVLADGKTVEVTKLMNLSFAEGICGDGTCAMDENAGTCIKDCPSGSADGYCDGISDGRCDTDCAAGGDPDCRTAATATTARSPSSPLAALAAAGGTALVLARRRD